MKKLPLPHYPSFLNGYFGPFGASPLAYRLPTHRNDEK